jgi:hypothetical protein
VCICGLSVTTQILTLEGTDTDTVGSICKSIHAIAWLQINHYTGLVRAFCNNSAALVAFTLSAITILNLSSVSFASFLLM